MRPSIALRGRTAAVRMIATRYNLANPRVYGSAARGTDTGTSDLDLLVDALPKATLFDLGGFQDEVEEMLGITVDVRTPGDLPAPIRARVLAEAKAL